MDTLNTSAPLTPEQVLAYCQDHSMLTQADLNGLGVSDLEIRMLLGRPQQLLELQETNGHRKQVAFWNAPSAAQLQRLARLRSEGVIMRNLNFRPLVLPDPSWEALPASYIKEQDLISSQELRLLGVSKKVECEILGPARFHAVDGRRPAEGKVGWRMLSQIIKAFESCELKNAMYLRGFEPQVAPPEDGDEARHRLWLLRRIQRQCRERILSGQIRLRLLPGEKIRKEAVDNMAKYLKRAGQPVRGDYTNLEWNEVAVAPLLTKYLRHGLPIYEWAMDMVLNDGVTIGKTDTAGDIECRQVILSAYAEAYPLIRGEAQERLQRDWAHPSGEMKLLSLDQLPGLLASQIRSARTKGII